MISLRDVSEQDLPFFFEYNKEPEAVYTAAFTTRDPADRDAFNVHWAKIMQAPSVLIKTIIYDDKVAGSILSFAMNEMTEISYWLGKDFWGKGIASDALEQFLLIQKIRPLYARVAQDNIASLKVLSKHGFSVLHEEKGFANGRGEEIPEFVMICEA